MTEVEPCRDCKLWRTSQTSNGLYSCNKMMGTGNPQAEIMFVGDWPGDDELKNRLPLSGLMGQLLKRAATSVGISLDKCYLTYLCKCKPAFDSPPGRVEMTTCSKYLLEEIRTVRPKIVVALGANVAAAFGIKGGITQVHGQISDYEVAGEEKFIVKVIPIYHPAYVNNFVEQAKQRKEFSQDLGKVAQFINGKEENLVQEVNYRVARTVEDVKEICKILREAEWISYDCETTGLDPFRDKVLITSFSDGPGRGYVIPYLYPGIFNEQEQEIVKQELGSVLGGSCKKIMQNGKFDIQFLFANKIPIKNFVFDTMLAHYLLDENGRHGLGAIVPTYTDMGNYKDEVGQYFAGKVKVLIEGNTEKINEEDGTTYYLDAEGKDISKSKAYRVATILDCPYDVFTKYAMQDADATFRLYKAFWPLLEQENLLKLLIQIVTPLSYVLANMEFTGIKGDKEYIQKATAQYKKDMDAFRESITKSVQVKKYLEKYNNGKKITKIGLKKIVGLEAENVLNYAREKKWVNSEDIIVTSFDGLTTDFKTRFSLTPEQEEQLEEYLFESAGVFNINSSVQKGRLLFDIMGLIPTKKNRVTEKQKEKGQKEGSNSVDIESLELLLKQNKIKLLEDIIGYGKIRKFQEYMLGYEKLLLASSDGRIHTSFNQHITKTGRLSSSNPNLQNIPKQDKERAKIIRKAFVAKEGYSLIEADYSQIEFRLWGHCSGDEKLLASLNKEGSDIHREVASKVFRVPIDKVTDTMRTIGKCATYGLVYGVSNFSLARDFNMEEEEVNRFMNNFYSAFPVAVNWVEGNIALMEKQGYVTNWAGRRRRATDIYSKVKELKAAAGRQARNSPMQGGAADLVNVAMIKTFKMLQPYGEGARLLLQIHDSLELEVRDDLLVELLPKIQYSMENAVQMKCKTPVVPEVGKNLGEMKKVRVREGKLEVLIEVKEDKKEVWEEYKI